MKSEAARVTWRGSSLPANEQAAFGASTRLVGTPGETLWFPATQRCDDGAHYDWTDMNCTSERPAPSIVLTAATLLRTTAPAHNQTQSLSLALAGLIGLTIAVGAVTYIRESRN